MCSGREPEMAVPTGPFRNVGMSKAAKTHRLRKLRTPAKCRKCNSYVYFQGAECEEVRHTHTHPRRYSRLCNMSTLFTDCKVTILFACLPSCSVIWHAIGVAWRAWLSSVAIRSYKVACRCLAGTSRRGWETPMVCLWSSGSASQR